MSDGTSKLWLRGSALLLLPGDYGSHSVLMGGSTCCCDWGTCTQVYEAKCRRVLGNEPDPCRSNEIDAEWTTPSKVSAQCDKDCDEQWQYKADALGVATRDVCLPDVSCGEACSEYSWEEEHQGQMPRPDIACTCFGLWAPDANELPHYDLAIQTVVARGYRYNEDTEQWEVATEVVQPVFNVHLEGLAGYESITVGWGLANVIPWYLTNFKEGVLATPESFCPDTLGSSREQISGEDYQIGGPPVNKDGYPLWVNENGSLVRATGNCEAGVTYYDLTPSHVIRHSSNLGTYTYKQVDHAQYGGDYYELPAYGVYLPPNLENRDPTAFLVGDSIVKVDLVGPESGYVVSRGISPDAVSTLSAAYLSVWEPEPREGEKWNYLFASDQWGRIGAYPTKSTGLDDGNEKYGALVRLMVVREARGASAKKQEVPVSVLELTEALPGCPYWFFRVFISTEFSVDTINTTNLSKATHTPPPPDSETHHDNPADIRRATMNIDPDGVVCPEYYHMYVTESWKVCVDDPPNPVPFTGFVGVPDSGDDDDTVEACRPMVYKSRIVKGGYRDPCPFYQVESGIQESKLDGRTEWLHEVDESLDPDDNPVAIPALRLMNSQDGHAYQVIRLCIHNFPEWFKDNLCRDEVAGNAYNVPAVDFSDSAFNCDNFCAADTRCWWPLNSRKMSTLENSCGFIETYGPIDPLAHVAVPVADDCDVLPRIAVVRDNYAEPGAGDCNPRWMAPLSGLKGASICPFWNYLAYPYAYGVFHQMCVAYRGGDAHSYVVSHSTAVSLESSVAGLGGKLTWLTGKVPFPDDCCPGCIPPDPAIPWCGDKMNPAASALAMGLVVVGYPDYLCSEGVMLPMPLGGFTCAIARAVAGKELNRCDSQYHMAYGTGVRLKSGTVINYLSSCTVVCESEFEDTNSSVYDEYIIRQFGDMPYQETGSVMSRAYVSFSGSKTCLLRMTCTLSSDVLLGSEGSFVGTVAEYVERYTIDSDVMQTLTSDLQFFRIVNDYPVQHYTAFMDEEDHNTEVHSKWTPPAYVYDKTQQSGVAPVQETIHFDRTSNTLFCQRYLSVDGAPDETMSTDPDSPVKLAWTYTYSQRRRDNPYQDWRDYSGSRSGSDETMWPTPSEAEYMVPSAYTYQYGPDELSPFPEELCGSNLDEVYFTGYNQRWETNSPLNAMVSMAQSYVMSYSTDTSSQYAGEPITFIPPPIYETMGTYVLDGGTMDELRSCYGRISLDRQCMVSVWIVPKYEQDPCCDEQEGQDGM